MPKGKRNLKIESPRGFVKTVRHKDGTVTSHFVWNKGCKPSIERGMQSAQEWVDSEVLRRCAPLVPFRTGVLQKTGTLMTYIGTGKVVYKTPYAKKMYYKAKLKGERGAKWFERMKANNKESLRKGAERRMRQEKK